MVGWPAGPQMQPSSSAGREGQEARAHGLLQKEAGPRAPVARAGVTLAFVPRNGPQHQPCCRGPGGRQLRGPRGATRCLWPPCPMAGISHVVATPPPAAPTARPACSREGSMAALPAAQALGRKCRHRRTWTPLGRPPGRAGPGPSVGASPPPRTSQPPPQ